MKFSSILFVNWVEWLCGEKEFGVRISLSWFRIELLVWFGLSCESSVSVIFAGVILVLEELVPVISMDVSGLLWSEISFGVEEVVVLFVGLGLGLVLFWPWFCF